MHSGFIGYVKVLRPFTSAILAASLLASVSDASAPDGTATLEDLRSIPTCSSAASDQSADCQGISALRGRARLRLTLTAKKASVPIGPYLVLTDTFNGTYLPPLLKLGPGQDFELRLVNSLEPPPTPLNMAAAMTAGNPSSSQGSMGGASMKESDLNLHTHGLLVSAKNARSPGRSTITEGNGDNIFSSTKQGHDFKYDIDVPQRITFPGGTVVQHPEGLFWYHPHIHGLAQRQVSAGLAGPISIGSPLTYLRRFRPNGRDAYVDPSLIKRVEEHYIVLKDILISAKKNPDEAAKERSRPRATWLGLKEASGAFEYPPEWSGGFLPTSCQQAAASGWCVPEIAKPQGFDGEVFWMFTTNGQLKPRIKVAPGHLALLRIVNESPTVSYDLRFGKFPDGGVPFYVVGLDGTLPGDVGRGKTFLNSAVHLTKRKSLLLLPASRADILIGGENGSTAIDMFTHGVSTGAEPGDADEWPAAALGRLEFSGRNVAPDDLGLVPQFHIPTTIASGPPIQTVPAGCTTPRLVNTPKQKQWRVIKLDSDESSFFIGSELRTQVGGGPSTDSSQDEIPLETMPMMNDEVSWEKNRHICVVQGETELWEVDNFTTEIHNFHIHQNKFKVAERPVDPNGVLARFDIFNGTSNDLNIWHDTFPVPPAATQNGVPDKNRPGKIFVVINFGANQQVGRYVFHCHILEHEDKGMMAPLEVLASARVGAKSPTSTR